jgi:hypothetical protein
MEKKMMISIGVIIVLVVLGFIIFGGSDGDSTNSQSSSTFGISAEEQKFAEFEAKLACTLLNIETIEDFTAATEETLSLMDEYGYDDDKYSTLNLKYENKEGFKELILSEVEKICPESLEQITIEKS